VAQRPTSAVPAFTLVELMIVIAIVALLVAMLLPVISKARRAANAAKCLSNMRNMQVAHWMYVTENGGYLIQAGLSHGGVDANEPVAWINTLQRYFGQNLLHRCPSDQSIHWPGEPGVPVPPTIDQFRRTSYGINDFLDWNLVPWGGPYKKITQIPRAAATIQFVEMVETGQFAGADHPHVENWMPAMNPNAPPIVAASQLQTHRHGGRPKSWESMCNYGYLDGHAEAQRFRDVFVNFTQNRFDPQVAQ